MHSEIVSDNRQLSLSACPVGRGKDRVKRRLPA